MILTSMKEQKRVRLSILTSFWFSQFGTYLRESVSGRTVTGSQSHMGISTGHLQVPTAVRTGLRQGLKDQEPVALKDPEAPLEARVDHQAGLQVDPRVPDRYMRVLEKG